MAPLVCIACGYNDRSRPYSRVFRTERPVRADTDPPMVWQPAGSIVCLSCERDARIRYDEDDVPAPQAAA